MIVDSEKEKVKLLSQSPDSWLSAVVPVYSRSELADMADGDWNEPERFISAYDKEYFQDAFTYKENIQKKLGETKQIQLIYSIRYRNGNQNAAYYHNLHTPQIMSSNYRQA